MDPMALFNADRSRARSANDPMAHLCTGANIDSTGRAQLRTLVLRDIQGQLAIFVNATSPKWATLQTGFALHTYWPSVQLQYRFIVTAEVIDPQMVHESWHLRPDMPKRMDWFYEQQGKQSSPVASRESLLGKISDIELPDPLHAPGNARGLLLSPIEVERLDLGQENGVHDRQYFTLSGDTWQQTTLVP